MPGRTLPSQNYLHTSTTVGFRAGLSVSLLLFITAAASANLQAAEPWASFQNGGHLLSATPLPERDWSELPSLEWKVQLEGYGQSSPVIWENQVYITSVVGPQKETYHLTAYSLQDGSKLWHHEFTNPSPQENSTYVSRSAPTPAADAQGVIVFSEGGNLLAFTHAGKLRWERNLVTDFGSISGRHGLSASLEQNESAVFAWVERETDPYILAVDKTTGKDLWKSPGLGTTSWASPRLIPVTGGANHLVLSGIGKIAGLDPQNGQLLWTFTDITGNSTPTPMPAGTGRFLIGATVAREGGGGREGRRGDGGSGEGRSPRGEGRTEGATPPASEQSSDGSQPAPAEQSPADNSKEPADSSTAESRPAPASSQRSAESNGLIEITQNDDQTWSAQYVWRARRATSSFGSPLPTETVAYFVNRTGVLYALDLQSGEELYAERIGDSIWATPMAIGDCILFFGKKGTLDVISKGKEFRSLGNSHFWADEPPSEEAFGGPVLYAVAITGPQLLIRRGDQLSSYSLNPNP